jgi:opacity protein-like surface antigen
MKSVFGIIGLLFSVFVLNAQSVLGVYGGAGKLDHVTRSSVNTPHFISSSEAGSMFNLGIHYAQRNKDHFNIGLDLDYLKANDYVEYYEGGLGGGSSQSLNVSTQLLTLKLLPEFSFGSKLRFYINFGPSLYYILQSKQEGTNFNSWSMEPQKNEKSELTGSTYDDSRIRLAVSTAIGLEATVSDKINVFANTTYAKGLNTIFDFSYYGINYRHLSINLGLSYRLENINFLCFEEVRAYYRNRKEGIKSSTLN